MNRPDFNEKINDEQRAALLAQDDDGLAHWWDILNHWQWPEGLPAPERVIDDRRQFVLSCRAAITDWIEAVVGRRQLLRTHNPTLTDEEFDDFYRGSYEGDEEAFARYALLIEEIARRPFSRTPEGRYGRINANDTPGAAARLRVSLDGRDLTNECYEANDVDGYVLCYIYEDDGKTIRLDEDEQLMRVRLEGDVTIWEVPADALELEAVA